MNDNNLEEKELDLTGYKCPMTFVYTKMNLEKLNPNEILKVMFDHKPAFKNVPDSVKIQKLAELIKTEINDNRMIFWFKKK